MQVEALIDLRQLKSLLGREPDGPSPAEVDAQCFVVEQLAGGAGRDYDGPAPAEVSA